MSSLACYLISNFTGLQVQDRISHLLLVSKLATSKEQTDKEFPIPLKKSRFNFLFRVGHDIASFAKLILWEAYQLQELDINAPALILTQDGNNYSVPFE